MKPTEIEVGQIYKNGKGPYVVLANDGVELTVRRDGSFLTETLNAEIQARIITNQEIGQRVRNGTRFPSQDIEAEERGQRFIEDWRRRDWRWWTMVGFLATSVRALQFEVPPMALDKLLDDLQGLTHVSEDQGGIYVLEEAPGQWNAYSGRIHFKASNDEAAWLASFLAGFCTVSAFPRHGPTAWVISKNAVVFELLALGFELGRGRWIADINKITKHIPEKHLDTFNKGLTHDLRARKES